jgi:hypothetical protein
MATPFTPFVEFADMDEDEVLEWAEQAVNEILRLRKFEALIESLGNVLDKSAYSEREIARAAKEFISA